MNNSPLDKIQNDHEEELFEYFSIDCTSGVVPIRIDKFLNQHIAHISRSRIQRAIKSAWVLVNGDVVKSNYKVRPLDQIVMHAPNIPDNQEVKPEQLDFDIIYEDDAIIVINKEAGMVVHPGVGNYTGTLLNGIAYYLREEMGEEVATLDRFGLVHRIDKDTSGLLLIAKSSDASSFLGKQFFNHTVEREYVGLVWGDVEQDAGTIKAHIGRHQRDRKQFKAYPDGYLGKHAVTHYKVLERFGFTTLVSFHLETGRTHQIRVHMKHIGHPLFMDKMYGGNCIRKGVIFSKYKSFVNNAFTLCPRQALHAVSLGFLHPRTQEFIKFEQEVPQEMAQVITKWRNYSKVIHH